MRNKNFLNVDKTSMLIQRRILGILCMSLAPLSILFGLFGLDVNPNYWYTSISSTYWANSKIIMIGLLFATAIFFFSYKGYDWKDRVCSLIQAISALGVIMFPTRPEIYMERTGLFLLPESIAYALHLTSASVLFVTFAINILCLFTIGSNEPTEKKKLRNKIYRVCGILIAVSSVLIGAQTLPPFKYIPKWFPYTMIFEFIALFSFGFAYLVKSEAIHKFNDEEASKE